MCESLQVQQQYLMSAMLNFFKCLSLSDDNDLKIFRLISLLFQNKSIVDAEALTENLQVHYKILLILISNL